MRFAIGSDHSGFALKQYAKAFLVERGEHVHDVGTADTTPLDYPDYVEVVAAPILTGDVDRGVLICGGGVGASVAANKIPGIRAGLCHDMYSAHQGVEHDDMNVLVFGARVIGQELAKDLVQVYLKATFSGEERHRRRLEKIKVL